MNEGSDPDKIKHQRIKRMINRQPNFYLGASLNFLKFWDSLENIYNVRRKQRAEFWISDPGGGGRTIHTLPLLQPPACGTCMPGEGRALPAPQRAR